MCEIALDYGMLFARKIFSKQMTILLTCIVSNILKFVTDIYASWNVIIIENN